MSSTWRAPVAARRLPCIGRAHTTLDPFLSSICDTLVRKDQAHTILLYGSRADSSANEHSDYDIAAFARRERTVRDARRVGKNFLDVFLYPEAVLQTPGPEHLPLRGSQVLLQRGQEATQFLEYLEDIHRKGPEPLGLDEISARLTWAKKMALRARRPDIEGNYRRTWLLTALLEDYFHIRAMWYEGPKKAIKWLSAHDLEIYNAFDRALKIDTSFDAIDALVKCFVERYEAVQNRAP
jgi:Polymerase beta, Nucleotidyltransferase